MYITITPQKTGGNYSQSSGDFVGYLEKENQGLEQQDMEYFFNQFGDEIPAEAVDLQQKSGQLVKSQAATF
jgi:hypothetical protein